MILSRGATIGSVTGEPGAKLFLGGNSDYTAIGVNQRFFAGAIAQAAVFTNALTATQIHDLYQSAFVPQISVVLSGPNAIINYTGTLLSSTNVTGPFLPVTGANPPSYSVPANEPHRFYRSSNP